MSQSRLAGWVVLGLVWAYGSAWAAVPAAKPDRMAGVRSPGKPAAAVTLHTSVRSSTGGKAAVASSLEIDLQFTAPAGTQWLEIQVMPTDYVTLVSGAEGRYEPGDKPVTHRVVVVPDAQGRHFISVSLAMQRGGEQRMRSFAVPLTVGAGAAGPRPANKGRVAFNSDGEAIVITHSR